MKQQPLNLNGKVVNSQENNGVVNKAGINATGGQKENKKSILTVNDLKGKKVDGDPSIESDQPVDPLDVKKLG